MYIILETMDLESLVNDWIMQITLSYSFQNFQTFSMDSVTGYLWMLFLDFPQIVNVDFTKEYLNKLLVSDFIKPD